MNRIVSSFLFFAVALPLLSSPPLLPAQSPSVPVSLVVTAKFHGSGLSTLDDKNLTVYQGRTRDKVTQCVPLQSDGAGLDLFILLDASRNISQGSQLEDIRRFILALPPSTKVALAYMQMGDPKIAQDLTADHQLAANALHASLSTLADSASPYESLGHLIEKWPTGNPRREVLMISNGIDTINGDSRTDKFDSYVEATIEKAQRAGIVVSTIATSGEDFGSSRPGQGKNNLAQLAAETGGQTYFYPSSSPITFAPYLNDFSLQLSHQYLVTFLAQPSRKAGMQSVKLRTELPHVQLVSAEKIYVPAAD